MTISSSKWPYGTQKVPGCASAKDTAQTCLDTKAGGILIEIFFEQLKKKEKCIGNKPHINTSEAHCGPYEVGLDRGTSRDRASW